MRENKLSEISPDTLLDEVSRLKFEGYRLVQIGCTRTQEGYELTYSFGLDYDLLNLRFQLADGTELSSISHIFPSAYFYENEIHDLFGVPVSMLSVDYKGNLYRTGEKTPFH